MSGIKFDANVTGFDQLERDLAEIRKRVNNFEPVFRKMGPWWVRRQRAHFRGNRSPRMPRLAASTIAKHGNHPPLIRTGNLYRSTIDRSPVTAGPDYAVFGIPRGSNTVKVAAVHANGGPGRRVPRRDPVPGLNAAEREELRDMIRNYVTEGLS